MRRDGDGRKIIGHVKGSPERRADLRQRTPPKKRHLAIYAGIAFAILGGLMVASTPLVSWVDSFDANNVLVEQLFVWDMSAVSADLNYLALAAPIVGIACAALSILTLMREERVGLRRLAAIGVMLTSAAAAVITALLILMLKEQYIVEQLDRSIYGPAVFLSVFGCVLAVAGGISLVADYIQSERNKGAFVTAAGSKHLKTALRPTTRGSRGWESGSHDLEIREEMLSVSRGTGRRDESGMPCPNCKSPVKADWSRCPICGEELT